VGVSIYYSASRQRPLSPAECAAIEWAVTRFPVESLIRECRVSEEEFNGESFYVYPRDENTEPNVVFEGATKLPSCTDDAMWVAVQYLCEVLSEVRRVLYDAEWHVHVDDYDIAWDDKKQAFNPSP
jgi:hypothetical protein